MNTFNPAAMAALAKGDLLNAVIASQANGIEMQEKAGQQEIVKLQRLPREGMHKYKHILEEIGFVVGKIVEIETGSTVIKVPIDKKQDVEGEVDRIVALGGNVYEFFLFGVLFKKSLPFLWSG
mgnify:CR=1 FL=1